MTRDPWRYRCIECGSVNLRYHPTAGEPCNGIEAETRWDCKECGNHSDVRKDMKTGKVIA